MTINKTTQYTTDPNTIPVDTSTGSQQTLQDALNERANNSSVFLTSNLTVNIPTDYSTLQEAIDDLSMLSVKQGAVIDLMIETGHQLTAGVLVEDGDYSQFQISSVDAEVSLDPSYPSSDLIKGDNARMPTLNCLIDANGLCEEGYFAENASWGYVNPSCGIRRAGLHACYARSASFIAADESIFQEAAVNGQASGYLAWGASTISAQDGNCDDSNYYGAQAAAGSFLNFRNASAQGCFSYGVRGTNAGYVNARAVNVSGSGANNDVAIRAFDGSFVHAGESTAQNCVVCAYAEHSSFINAKNADFAGASDTAIVCLSGSIIAADGADMSGSSQGIRAISGGKVSANSANINGTAGPAVDASNGAEVNLSETTIDNCNSATHVIRALNGTINGRFLSLQNNTQLILLAEEGGTINIPRSTFTGHGTDVVDCSLGSYVNVFNSGLTDSEFNIASNSYTRAGIIIL